MQGKKEIVVSIDFYRGRLLIVQNNNSKLKKNKRAKWANFFSINMSDEPTFCFTFKSSKSAVVLLTSQAIIQVKVYGFYVIKFLH